MKKLIYMAIALVLLGGCAVHPPNDVTKQEAMNAAVYRPF